MSRSFCRRFAEKAIFSSLIFFGLIKFSTTENDINCILLKHCPLALKMVETRRNDPNIIKFLKFTHCGFQGKEPMVWCNLFEGCKTPEGKDGKCISIRKCDSFVKLIKEVDVSQPNVTNYLKDFRCSTVYDPDIKVCCEQTESTNEVDDENLEKHGDDSGVEDRFSTILPNPHLQECGRQNNDNRIYGGVETNIDEFPWMALLRYRRSRGGLVYGCGGSLIHSRFVLTAGHCLDPIMLLSKGLKSLHRVILGEYDTNNKTDCIYDKYGVDCADPVQEIEMDTFKIHPGYMSGYTDHDIGIIKLKAKIRYSDFIRPICLPTPTVTLTKNDIYMISGWGKTSKDNTNTVKRKARIEVVDNEKCNAYSPTPLQEGKICAGGTGDGVDACFGDSGGPLMLGRNVNKSYINFVVGIISHGFGKTCGEGPGVYTFVPYYVEWIRSSLDF